MQRPMQTPCAPLSLDSSSLLPICLHRCSYIHMGSLAYLGMNRAILQLPPPLPPSSIKGWLAGEVWKALELAMQVGDLSSALPVL